MKPWLMFAQVFVLLMPLVSQTVFADGFRRVAIGQVFPNESLPSLQGDRHPVLAAKASINLVAFVRPNHARSLQALSILSGLTKAYASLSPNMVVIVSGDFSQDQLRSLATKSGLNPRQILIDKDYAYYGKVGVILHPTIGIIDSSSRLLAYEAYSQIDYEHRLTAQLQKVTSRIDQAEYKRVLVPPKLPRLEAKQRADLDLQVAKMMLEKGKLNKAYLLANKALEKDQDSLVALAVIGFVYAKQASCTKAIAEIGAHLQKANTLPPEVSQVWNDIKRGNLERAAINLDDDQAAKRVNNARLLLTGLINAKKGNCHLALRNFADVCIKEYRNNHSRKDRKLKVP